MAYENEIRDVLARRLNVIEADLVLVDVNFHLQNAEGTRGFVDILARDTTEMLVVIELKRSDSAAREALHEVGKYMELLSREKGIPSSNIRAIIVSTEWNELLVPFSYYASKEDFPITGYELFVDVDGVTPIHTTKVTPLVPPGERVLTRSQRLIASRNAASVNSVWTTVSKTLTALGVSDFVGEVITRHTEDETSTQIVLTLGTIIWNELRLAAIEVLEKDWATCDMEFDGYPSEELALDATQISNRALLFEYCDPDRVSSLKDAHRWEHFAWLRSGVFEDERLFPSEHLESHTMGWKKGLSDSRLSATVRPANKAQWSEFRENVDLVLGANHGWKTIINRWMDEKLPEFQDGIVQAHIYNPMDFLQIIAHAGWDVELQELTPGLAITFRIEQEPMRAVGLIGALSWDGKHRDLTVPFSRSYPNIGVWADARQSGQVAEIDIDLTTSIGLRYSIWEKHASAESPELLTLTGSKFSRSPERVNFLGKRGYEGIQPLQDFIESYGPQLASFSRKIRSTLLFDPATATQMHMIDNTVKWEW